MIKIGCKFTSLDFLRLGHQFAKNEGTLLLYSGGSYASSKISYLCLFPSEKIAIHLEKGKNPWEELKKKLTFEQSNNDLPAWVGYLSYELGAFSDEKQIPFYEPSIPLALFYKPSIVLEFDHEQERLNIHPKDANLHDLKTNVKKVQSEFKAELIYQESLEEYAKKIYVAKEHILNGNIYQVNISHQTLFKAEDFCPFSYFEKVTLKNPTPFSAFLSGPGFSIMCTSPERFLRKKKNSLETMPIKGTRPRGNNEHEDLKQMVALKNSPKEFAELLMITDLLRNDLGKVSVPGSVQVIKLHHLETYQNVFHQSSLITSSLKSNLHSVDALQALFPGGSISGCPKLKALELIYELEKRPRHIYTGSIGYLTNRGDFDFNIAIRTCLYKDTILDIQLGAGIVYDSDPESEYHETLSKGATLIGALS